MPTPDRFDGPALEEETQYEDRGPAGDNTGDPTVVGALRRVTETLRYRETGGVAQILKARNPPAPFNDVDLTGLSNGQVLVYEAASQTFKPGSGASAGDDPDSLFNDLNESYDILETRDANLCPTNILAHAPGAPATKIREIDQITYDAQCNINGMRIRQYAGDGTTVVETMTYNGSGWVKS